MFYGLESHCDQRIVDSKLRCDFGATTEPVLMSTTANEWSESHQSPTTLKDDLKRETCLHFSVDFSVNHVKI